MTFTGAGGQGPRKSDLPTRVLSALVLIVLALGAAWAGGLAFSVFSAAVAGAIFYEWSHMAARNVDRRAMFAAGVGLALVLVLLLIRVNAATLFLALGIATLGVAMLSLRLAGAGWAAAGLAYAGLAALSLALLRGAEQTGLAAIVFLFAIVWATDILAYFVGRSVGGPKLAPPISPGKTWSGAIGGAIAGTAAGAIAWHYLVGPTSLFGVAVLALVLAVVSEVGDLGESALKRFFKVKDSGGLIPGHGGVMDRVDGLVASALVLYIVGAASGGLDTPSARLFFQLP